jgi:hypothetical protein
MQAFKMGIFVDGRGFEGDAWVLRECALVLAWEFSFLNKTGFRLGKLLG